VDLEVRHLRLVAAIADYRSLTRASEELHLTQSALSHQLRDIEDRLGAPLFYRLNKRMEPTPAGERLIASARQVLEELTVVETAIRGGLKEVTVPLRLSTECYTCYHWLPAVLRPFQAQYPNVEVRVDAGATRRPLPALLEGRLDLAVMSSSVRDSRVVVKPLFEDEQVALVADDHPFARLTSVRLADFRRERLITYVRREDSHFVTRVLEPAGVVPKAIEPVALTEAIIEMVRAGRGVAVLARWSVAHHLTDGSLRAIRVTSEGLRREWKAVIPKRLEGAEYMDEFLRLVTEHAPAPRRDVLAFGRKGA
jgi:LysR family transcriptional regulator for metE and metH